MSVEKPLVSVIIPVYNTEDYLEECLDSVLNQTLKEIEVICIDDKSTDNSLKILEEYAKKDSRIKILKNKENVGQGISRNKGLKEVKGEYISFLDSDDKIELDGYEKLYNFSKNHNQDIILFNAIRFDENGKFWESELHVKSITKTIEKTNIIKNNELIYDTSACNKFIKTSFFKKNNIEFIDRLYEDLLFSMKLFTSTNSIGINPNVTYYWRRRRNDLNKSTTQERTNIKNIKDRIFITKEILNIFKSDKKYKILINQYYFKLVDIDYRLYIDQIDKGNDEYKNIILNEIKPIVKTFPKEIFEKLNEIRKLKYDILINGNIENLIYIVSNERENKKLERENKKLKKKNDNLKDKNNKLKEELKVVKSTKGWIKYKSNNIYNRTLKSD